MKTETVGVPKLALKIFFNALEEEAQKRAPEEQKVNKLKVKISSIVFALFGLQIFITVEC